MGPFQILLIFACLAAGHARADDELDWWQPGIIYQIYPRSFKDSDGDGIGDLQGINQMIPHLKNIGVSAVWLSPIFKSPGKDFGYDVSDYKSIDPIFGTLEDFKELAANLRAAGIYLLLDIVPNHSSDEHEWFINSAKRIDPYTDYYVWRDGIGPLKNQAPNNWASNFDGSMWKWNDERQQFYLHQFLEQQPDLNYNNPRVIAEMQDVFRFWNNYDVHGFRLDAVSSIWEDLQYLDEPLVYCNNVSHYLCFDHIYTNEQNDNFRILGAFKQTLDELKKMDNITRLMMTESYTTNWDHLRKYYNVTNFPFNFFFITNLDIESTGSDFLKVITDWYSQTEDAGWANWVVGNHDRHRVATRFGREMADPINMLILIMKATAVTYNGEELGMVDSFVRADQTKDPQGLRTGDPSQSRDPNRGPMIWNDTKNAGFTNGTPWLPIQIDYISQNVETQMSNNRSHLHVYIQMRKLRQTWLWKYGNQTAGSVNGLKDVIAVYRWAPENPTIMLLMNVGNVPHNIDLSQDRPSLPPSVFTYCISENMPDMPLGAPVNTTQIELPAKSAAVFISQDFSWPLKINSTASMSTWDLINSD